MKNKTYKKIFLVILFTVVLVFLFLNINYVFSFIGTLIRILSPVIIGFIIGYILNMLYKIFYNKVFKKLGQKNEKLKKAKKPLSIILCYIVFLGLLALLGFLLVPQVIRSIEMLRDNLPEYANTVASWISNIMSFLRNKIGLDLPENPSITYLISYLSGGDLTGTITSVASWAFPYAWTTLLSTATGTYNVIIGLIISVYVLVSKESLINIFRKIIVAVFSKKGSEKVFSLCRITDKKCGKFISGKIIDSLILGVLYFIVLQVFGFVYAPLIAVVMATTNLIPFFGPFIGAIPSALLLLVAAPKQFIWFILVVAVLQVLDGNVLAPKILGDSVGLSGFWIMFAVIAGGGLFGVAGMVLGVPVFAVIYTVVKDAVSFRLKKKALQNNMSDISSSDEVASEIINETEETGTKK